jgi:ABC-type glycerol-3-phosphate transport system permease component
MNPRTTAIVLVAAAPAMLPSIIALQRSFMRGISAGAIKG